MDCFTSWGRYPPHSRFSIFEPDPERREIVWPPSGTLLPVGLGRSYGDLSLNSTQAIAPMRGFLHFLSFDEASRVVRCEAGVSLKEIL